MSQADYMQIIDTDTGNAASFIITSPNNDTGPDPVCWLFTDTSYAGDAWCARPGIGICQVSGRTRQRA